MRHFCFGLLIALSLLAPAHAQQFCIQLGTGNCPQNTTSPIGLNLSPPSYFDTNDPFDSWTNNAVGWGFGNTGLNGAAQTESANGSFLSGQAVIPFTSTSQFQTGWRCIDNTSPATLNNSTGIQILSIQAGVSVTLTSNVTQNSGGAADSITCGGLNDLSLDSNGWPLSSSIGYSGLTYTDGIGLLSSEFTTTTSGTVTVFCNAGQTVATPATLTFFNGVTGTVSCPTPANGTVKTYTSGGQRLFITGMDQTAHGWHITSLAVVPTERVADYLAGHFINQNYLNWLQYFRTARFMDWQDTAPGHTGDCAVTTWASRPTTLQPFFASTYSQLYGNGQCIPEGVPVEVEVELINRNLMNGWFNIPVNAADDYITNHATYVNANLNPSLKAFYEYYNEAFNIPAPLTNRAIATNAFPWTITGITLGSPTVLTITPPGQATIAAYLSTANTMAISGIITGPTQLNGNTYAITATSSTTISLNVNTTGSAPWSSGGVAYVQQQTATGLAFSFYSMQACHVMTLAAPILGSKIIRVLGTQAANIGVTNTELGSAGNTNWWGGAGTTGRACYDTLAAAPYFDYGIPEAWSAWSTANQTAFFQEINSGGAIPQSTGANTTTGTANAYSLTSSSACGNGAIASTPANGTMTCLQPNINNTGDSTLTVDGGTTYPIYSEISSTNNLSSYKLTSGELNSTKKYIATFTSQTGASAWSSATTYVANALVSGSDNNTYFSVAGSNLNHNPVGDAGVHWTAITPAWWICNCSPFATGMIAQAAAYAPAQLSALSALGISNWVISGYESGQQIANPANTFTFYTMVDAQADSRMGTAYTNYWTSMAASGFGMMNHYADIQVQSIFGTYGLNTTLANTVSAPTPEQTATKSYILANPRPALPFLLNRDLDPASNDNSPAWLNKAA